MQCFSIFLEFSLQQIFSTGTVITNQESVPVFEIFLAFALFEELLLSLAHIAFETILDLFSSKQSVFQICFQMCLYTAPFLFITDANGILTKWPRTDFWERFVLLQNIGGRCDEIFCSHRKVFRKFLSINHFREWQERWRMKCVESNEKRLDLI